MTADQQYALLYRERNGDPEALAREVFTPAAPPPLGRQKPRKPPKKRGRATTCTEDEDAL